MKRLYKITNTSSEASFTVLLTTGENQFTYSTDGKAVTFCRPLKTKEDFALLGALFGYKFLTGYNDETGENISSITVTKEDI